MIFVQIFMLGLVLIDGFLRPVTCCTQDSKELHICLNIFLERDYPLVEAILKAQQQFSTSRRGMVLLEGPDLNSICQHIESLQSCFAEVAEECVTYWHIYRFDRMMRSLLALYNLLCSGSREGLKALLTYAICIQRILQYDIKCQDDRFHWNHIWKQMLRLEVDEEICEPLDQQRQCMTIILQKHLPCGHQAPYVYNQTMTTWLTAWCSAGSLRTSKIFLLISLFVLWWTI